MSVDLTEPDGGDLSTVGVMPATGGLRRSDRLKIREFEFLTPYGKLAGESTTAAFRTAGICEKLFQKKKKSTLGRFL